MIRLFERQAARRIGVIVLCAVCLGNTALMQGIYADVVPRTIALPLMLFFVGIFLTGFHFLTLAVRDYGVHSNRGGDERARMVWDSAFRSAYLFFTSALMLFAIYVNIAWSKSLAGKLWVPESVDEWSTITWTFAFLTMTLPQAIIAWREPDAPVDGLSTAA